MTTFFTRGKFGRRNVAVKRIQLDEVTAIRREVDHLIELDNHPNIIR